MWRRPRLITTQLRALAPLRSDHRFISAGEFSSSPSTSLRPTATLFSRQFSSESGDNAVTKKKIEEIMPIATGHEREELEAQVEGRKLLELNDTVGPFGTKEAPAVIKSNFDKRIVGCPGGEGEDEHDVIWFWLEKGKPFECPVCSQYFVLEVIGAGGPLDHYHSEDDDDDHHH